MSNREEKIEKLNKDVAITADKETKIATADKEPI